MIFLDYVLKCKLPDELSATKITVKTINPHSYCVAKKDKGFKKSLQKADYLLPDGVGVVWALNFLYGEKIRKISGFDLHQHYLNLLNEKSNAKVFYLGSTDSTLQKIVDRLEIDFPLIEVCVFSPPFRAKFSKEESLVMIQKVNEFKPDILFVGMTAPKQEKWVFQNRENLDVNVICAIGAVFDFYAGTVIRPSQFWIGLGLEWLPRLFRDPRRLWRRTLISSPEFVFDIMKTKVFGKL